ncbi:hypothetical protein ACN38_g12966 [Penicillium nordicum]|uniref:Uncharacterized protein n=1 Tax=Penicillium nordicum TaxID=229535 RepID=A0A0N0RXA6_9EURO|nr:hypothetical protein ACN38_g12966 [Penicillium nordicum]
MVLPVDFLSSFLFSLLYLIFSLNALFLFKELAGNSRSRRDWYGEAYAPGEVQPTPGVKECILRATRRDEPDQRAEAVARLLFGGGAPAERLCATPRTDRGDCLLCGGGSVDPAVLCEQKIPRASLTGEGADDLWPCRFPGTAGGGYGSRRPLGVK